MQNIRNTEMLADRQSGMTYIALGVKYNITPGRARQICRSQEMINKLNENPLFVFCGSDKNYLRALHRVNVNTLDDFKRYVADGNAAPRGIGVDAFAEIVKRL